MRIKTLIPADLLPHILYCVTALIIACMFRYSFVAAGDTKGYLLDRWTGKLKLVDYPYVLDVRESAMNK
jgi:hypothetical protein